MQGNRIEIVIDTQADGDAEAQLQRLRATLRSLIDGQTDVIRKFGEFAGGRYFEKTTNDIRQQVTALERMGAEAKRASASMQEAASAAQNIAKNRLDYSLGPDPERRIMSAAAMARQMATNLGSAAEADNRLRQAADEAAGAINRGAVAAERMLVATRQSAGGGTALGFVSTQSLAPINAWIDAQQKLQQESAKTFNTITGFFNKQATEQEKAAKAGYDAAAKEIERERVLRQRELEAIGNQTIRAATARAEAASRVQSQEVYRSYATGEMMPGQVRSRQAGFMSPEDVATAGSLVARMDILRQSGERTNNVLRLNRIGFLELQAAGINTMQALASGMNPFHVAVMESSQALGALIQGGLIPMTSLWSFLINPITAAIAGVAALGAGVAAIVYNMRQANDEFSKAASSAMLQGRPTRLVEENARAMAAQIQASGGMGRVESRAGAIAVQIIPNISAQARTDIQESFEALTRTFEGDAQKAAEFLQQTFGSTSTMKAFVDQNVILNDELRKTFNEAVAAGDGLTASGIAAQGLKDRLQPTIDGLRQARSELGWLGRQMDIFGVGFENLLRRQTGQGRLETPTFAPGTQRPTEIDQKAIEATEKQLRTEEEINGILRQRQNILAGIAAATAGSFELDRFQQGRAEVERRLAESHTPLQQEAHNVRMAQLQTELTQAEEAAQKDSGLRYRVLEITKQIAEETANYQQGALNRVADAAKRASAEEIAARQRVREEARRIQQDQLTQSQFESQFRVAVRPADVSLALVENQRQINLLKAVEVGQEDQLRSKQLERLGLIQQLVNYETQANSARLGQAETFAQARGDLAAIVDLRRQELALVQRNFAGGFATDAQRVQAQTALIQSQVQAQQRGIQLTQQATEQANQFATNRSQTNIAALNLEVTQYNMTKTQAVQAEMSLTRSVMEQNQARLRSLLQTQGLTVDQRAQINTQLAGLYEQDAQKQIELQSRLTEAIRAENERRLQYMKNFFDQVGSSAADVLIAGITKSQTRTEALQNFARSVVSSFVKEASSMASQFAGKGLASMLGVKVDPSGDTGIGTVLSKWIGSQLGLTKDEPKVDQAAISEKMKLAGDTQKTAADLMLQAAQTMAQAAGKGPYAGGAGAPEALKPQTPVQTVQPYKPSPPTDYGATGEYGVGQPQAAMTLVEPLSSSTKSVSGLPPPRPSAWMSDSNINSGLRNVPGLDTQAQSSALTQFKQDIKEGTESGTKAGMSNAPINIEPLSNLTQDMSAQTQATQQAIQQTTQGIQAEAENSNSVKELTQVIREQSQQKQMPSSLTAEQAKSGGTSGTGTSLGDWSSRPSSNGSSSVFSSQSLGLLTQGLGLAATAASIFGRNLSTTGRVILGAIGGFSQLLSFGKNLSGLFSTVGDASKGVSGTMSLLQTANTANTLSTTLNTTATYANSTAQTTAAASSAGGSALGGIGTLFKAIPFIGGLFEQGGIVPSAAGGMVVAGMGGSGQLSILHPREMVLPSRLSEGIQNLINTGSPAEGQSSTVTNAPTFNYEANVTGYHPYESRRQFESMLRNHGATMQEWVENSLRNGLFKPA